MPRLRATRLTASHAASSPSDRSSRAWPAIACSGKSCRRKKQAPLLVPAVRAKARRCDALTKATSPDLTSWRNDGSSVYVRKTGAGGGGGSSSGGSGGGGFICVGRSSTFGTGGSTCAGASTSATAGASATTRVTLSSPSAVGSAKAGSGCGATADGPQPIFFSFH